jgi:hypothetical protein
MNVMYRRVKDRAFSLVSEAVPKIGKGGTAAKKLLGKMLRLIREDRLFDAFLALAGIEWSSSRECHEIRMLNFSVGGDQEWIYPILNFWETLKAKAGTLFAPDCEVSEGDAALCRQIARITRAFHVLDRDYNAPFFETMTALAERGKLSQCLAHYHCMCWGATYGAFYDSAKAEQYKAGPFFNRRMERITRAKITELFG